jgi:hypothetical protein
MLADEYQAWWHAGCKKTQFVSIPSPLTAHLSPLNIELARITINQWDSFQSLLSRCDQQTILVVEDIWRNWLLWQQIARDPRTGTTFDLYYSGIVFFDTKRYKHNYKINF